MIWFLRGKISWQSLYSSKKKISLKKKTFIKLVKIFLFFIIFSAFSIFLSNKLVEKNAQGKIYSETTNIPKNNVGLVLGTSKLLRNGRITCTINID